MASPNTLVLSAKQLTALRKHDRQQSNLVRIKDANRNRYEQGCASLQMAAPAPPERKWAVELKDDNRPFLTRDSFVKVEEDFSPGHNRPCGYGYITQCHGVGGAAVYDVRFTPAYDGGRIHRRITLDHLTSCSPFDDLIAEGYKRARKQTAVTVTSHLPQPKVDTRSPIQKLTDALISASRRGKKEGWHRRSLGLQTGKQFNKKETQQFTIELMLLEQYLDSKEKATDNELKRY